MSRARRGAGDRLSVVIGDGDQELRVITRGADGPIVHSLFAVRSGALLGAP